MSQIEVNLCSLLLREYFGEVVQKTGTYLMEQVCGRPLRQIIEGTSLPVKKVKSCLRVLIFHHFCDFNLNKKNIVEYSMNIKQVLLLIQYPRYMYSAKILYGDAAELLVEELLNNGRMIMSRAIQKVVERLQEATGKDYTMKEIASVKSKFVDLVEAKFFKRCPMPMPSEGDGPIPVMSLSSKEEYLVPEIKLYLLGKDSSKEPPVEQQNSKQVDASGEHEGHHGPSSKKRRIADSDFAVECSSHDIQPSKKQKIEKEPFPDKGIYWRINNDRFHQYFRDESIVSAVANIHGRKASDVVRTLLRMSETRSDPWVCSTNPIARHEILPVLLKGTNVQDYELDSFLSILSEHPYSFLSKVDERSGGMYVVNISKCLQQVVEALATAVVRDSFGNKCSRIFNLLLSTKNLEQKYIEEIAMISAREAKQLTYRLLKENFIIAKEIPKTQDHVPSREIYVLSADVTQVCRSLLQKCYKQIINALIRFESINRENKRLLDKKQRIDAIVNTLQLSCADFSQVEEVEQMITPPERMILEKVKNSTEKLEACQIQLAEDIYLLKIWLDSLPLK